MAKKKFKSEYIIGYGHPYVFTSGLNEGVIFYSDTDKRLSNTRDTYFPKDFKISDRNVPEYELVLRRKRHATEKRWAKERKREEKDREDRKANKKGDSEARCSSPRRP